MLANKDNQRFIKVFDPAIKGKTDRFAFPVPEALAGRIDFRGIQDAPMREVGIDYFENSRWATYAQRNYAYQILATTENAPGTPIIGIFKGTATDGNHFEQTLGILRQCYLELTCSQLRNYHRSKRGIFRILSFTGGAC